MTNELLNLLTDKERETLDALRRLVPSIKNQYFKLGRDIDKFLKLCEQLNKGENK